MTVDAAIPTNGGAELAAIGAAIWRELQAATHDRTHEWRTAVLATVDGERADARIVVLREADAGGRLVVFSDARAGKVAQLRHHPLATMVFWSPALSWQLRARLRFETQADGLAVSSRWTRLKLTPAARDYLSPLAPGTPLDGPPPPRPATVPRDERAHFAVLEGTVLELDWMEIHPAGHRRACFDAAGVARWLQA